MDKQKIAELRGFIDSIKQDPSILHLPELNFFRDFLHSLGATIPEDEFHDVSDDDYEDPLPPREEDFSEENDPGRIAKESELAPKIVVTRELSELEQDKVNELKSECTEAMENGDFVAALRMLSEVIELGGGSAMVLTRRAEVLLKLKRPLAAIADCDAALVLNPDSAKAYRVRGLAYRGLQQWGKAHSDLANAQKIDFDEAIEPVKKLVDEKWKLFSEAMRDHRIKCEENAKLRKQRSTKPTSTSTGFPSGGMPGGFPSGGMPGGFPGGGMPGGFPGNLMGDLLNDPEMMRAMSNPRVMTAFQSMMSNPASILQYQNDPEIGPILMKLMSKMGGGMR